MRYLMLALVLIGCGRDPNEGLAPSGNLAPGANAPEPGARPIGRDGVIIERCSPGELFCQGAAIIQCDSSGELARSAAVTGCVDTVLDTCAFCAGESSPTCVASSPQMQGILIGAGPSPFDLSVTGCGSEGSLRHTENQAGTYEGLVLTAERIGAYNVTVNAQLRDANDVSITSGVTFPLEDRRIRLRLNDDCASAGALAIAAPYPGTARVTWSSTTPGSEVRIELEGPVTCNSGSSWQDIRLDVIATIN